MTCVSHGFPVPSLSWLQQHDKLVTETDRVNITRTVTEENQIITSTLMFAEVERNDTGSYSCKAENLVGLSQKKANLTVLGRNLLYNLPLLFTNSLHSTRKRATEA